MRERLVVRCIHGQGQERHGYKMTRKTHKNSLSKREVEILRCSPYIKSVTASSVSFTEDFKQMAYDAKLQGVSVAETMKKNGIDPKILGIKRIENFSYLLNKKAKSTGGFKDKRRENYHRPAKTGEETMEDRVRQLEHDLAYTRQEVEFLKKLQAVNMEAQRKWESKHRQK